MESKAVVMRPLLLAWVAGGLAISVQVALAAPAVGPAPAVMPPPTDRQGSAATPSAPSVYAAAAVGETSAAPSAPAAATSAGPTETLLDALAAAYTTNPSLLAARAQQRALDETIPQASGGWKPTVQLQGQWGETITHSTTRDLNRNEVPPGSRNDSHPFTYNATITQPLFRGGRTYFGVRQAEHNVRAGRARLTSTEQQTLLGVVTAYFNVIRDTATVDLNTNNITVLQRQLDAANDRFRVGEITRTDVAQAEARLKLAETQLIQSQANLVASRDAYKTAVGRPPGKLDTSPPLPDLPKTEDEALGIAKENSPALTAAREAEKASNDAVKVAVGALLPSVSLQAQSSHSQGQGSFGPLTGFGGVYTNSNSITGQLTVPIYQAGTEYASIRSAKHTASQNRLLIAQAERDVEENVANAWEQVRATTAAIASNQEQVNANKIAYDGVVQEAEVGSRTTLDVLNAEQELLNSQVALVQSQRDQYVAAFSLLSSVGLLTAQQLALPVGIYDPTANTRSLMWKQFWPGAGE